MGSIAWVTEGDIREYRGSCVYQAAGGVTTAVVTITSLIVATGTSASVGAGTAAVGGAAASGLLICK